MWRCRDGSAWNGGDLDATAAVTEACRSRTNVNVKPVRASTILRLALTVAAGESVACLAAESTALIKALGGSADPSLLPVAARQAPSLAAYTAFVVATRPAASPTTTR